MRTSLLAFELVLAFFYLTCAWQQSKSLLTSRDELRAVVDLTEAGLCILAFWLTLILTWPDVKT